MEGKVYVMDWNIPVGAYPPTGIGPNNFILKRIKKIGGST